MDDAQNEKFRQRLLALQVQLQELQATGDEASKTVSLDQSSVGRLSRMDALQGQAMSQERGRRRTLELRRIAAALNRIEAGDYGYCVRCGEEIALPRLELDPAAALCIQCASQDEAK
jgi:DnaK suppressor protein